MRQLAIFLTIISIAVLVFFIIILYKIEQIEMRLNDRVSLPLEDVKRFGRYMFTKGTEDWQQKFTITQIDSLTAQAIAQ